MKSLFLKISIGVIVLAIIGVLVIGLWSYAQLQPVDARNSQEVTFVIPKGQAITVIGKRLQEEHLIKNAFLFRVIVWKQKLAGKIQAGSFKLAPNLSLLEVSKALTKGTEDRWVTIPEGYRAEEIAELFKDFDQFDQQSFLQKTKTKEGYLFPDTYLFPQAATEDFIFSYLTNTFDKKTANLQKKVEENNGEWDKVVVMASIVQREAKTAEEMKLVAGILQNRLDIGQALQVDATLQYIKGYDNVAKKWWTPPLAVDKELNSPFNTYKNAGLPPSPICNPGIEAITAVVEPTKSEYLYYIHDTKGVMHYAKTYEEHVKNVNMYLR